MRYAFLHEMMKILFVDNCSQETYLADVSIRCSRQIRASNQNQNVGKISFLWTVVYKEYLHHFMTFLHSCTMFHDLHVMYMYTVLYYYRSVPYSPSTWWHT